MRIFGPRGRDLDRRRSRGRIRARDANPPVRSETQRRRERRRRATGRRRNSARTSSAPAHPRTGPDRAAPRPPGPGAPPGPFPWTAARTVAVKARTDPRQDQASSVLERLRPRRPRRRRPPRQPADNPSRMTVGWFSCTSDGKTSTPCAASEARISSPAARAGTATFRPKPPQTRLLPATHEGQAGHGAAQGRPDREQGPRAPCRDRRVPRKSRTTVSRTILGHGFPRPPGSRPRGTPLRKNPGGEVRVEEPARATRQKADGARSVAPQQGKPGATRKRSGYALPCTHRLVRA